MKKLLKLRPVSITDMKLIFDWSNETEVRNNSFNTNPIPWKEHKIWFANTIKDNNILFYVLTDTFNNNIGQIRVKFNENRQGTISFSIDKNYRKRGFGKEILKLTEAKIKDIFQNFQLIAFVKPSNVASQKSFIANNYIEVKRDDLNIEYNKNC